MSELGRRLGLVHVVCIASGALISSGLFVLPGLAHARAGPAVVISYLLAGGLAAVGLINVAELTTAMPRAGGDYFFISRALGSGLGTVAGLLSWFSISMKAAFALVGIGALSEMVLPVPGRLVAGVFLAVFCLMNLYGVRKAANVQVALTGALLLLLVAFVVLGAGEVEPRNFSPLAPEGWTSIFSTAGFVFVAFGAAMQVAGTAEEIKEPGHNIPRGIGLSIAIVTVLYVAVVGVATGMLPGEELDNSMTPLSDAAAAFAGRPGLIAMSIGALLAFLTTANAGVMTASRYLLVLSEDKLAPEPLSLLHSDTEAPWMAILVTSALLVVALLLPLELLVESASAVFVIMYILACLSVVVLREGQVQNYRPVFHAPLYPYLQIIGIAGFIFVLFEMSEAAFLVAGLLSCGGLALYWFYGRTRRSSESALLHLIARVTDQELTEGTLETELRDVVRKRDKMELDRLDRLIEGCPILDLEREMDASAFFELVGEALAPTLDYTPEQLAGDLMRRENSASTVLRPGVAVPHLRVDDEDVYKMLIARSKPGITFPDEEEPVHAVFVLIASTDNRDFQLRVIAGIAQMVQAPEFDENWMNAHGEERLRDLLLLEERMRIR